MSGNQSRHYRTVNERDAFYAEIELKAAKGQSNKQIAQEYNLSSERISQIRKIIFKRRKHGL